MDFGSADWISALSSLGTLIAAIAALIVAIRQIKLSKEIEAFNSYESYHRLMLEYPHLGSGQIGSDASLVEKWQYETFVLSMLLTMERVMILRPQDPSWEIALEDDLNLHKRFLCSAEFVPLAGTLNEDVAAFIKRTAQKDHWKYPAAREAGQVA